jgi:Mlc titration factor MtfA (ptsG expression regulator)
MPFDTTYHIPPGQNTTVITYTKTGGRDTDIYLKNGELPPGLDSLPQIDNSYSQNIPSTTVQQKKADHFTPSFEMIFFFITIFLIILFRVKRNIREEEENNSDELSEPGVIKNHIVRQPYLTYYGEELNFSEAELTAVLTKRFTYFNSLSVIQQQRFLKRLRTFIANKVFKIHDEKGYKEMPILISAAAIQLTFGLEKYLLPNFEFIHVYPQEFMRIQETICFLEGNVSGHAINLSWKHFLEGYADPNDGQNVGLHELAHALYYQTFVAEENVDRNFRDTFGNFNSYGNKVFEQELQPGNDLYSDYALKNFQEFWAESAEIFFEKPAAMKASYPQLYDTLKFLLNQDPYNKIAQVDFTN